MTKFQVGDRVRYTGADKYHDKARIGWTGTVVGDYANASSYSRVQWDKDHSKSEVTYAENLELIEPTCKFKVGDRVRVQGLYDRRSHSYAMEGEEGIIRELIHPNRYKIDFFPRSCIAYPYPERDLVLVEPSTNTTEDTITSIIDKLEAEIDHARNTLNELKKLLG